jgi:hypothetical protein
MGPMLRRGGDDRLFQDVLEWEDYGGRNVAARSPAGQPPAEE